MWVVSESTVTFVTTSTPDDFNYTELLGYAELDALVELHGHIRANRVDLPTVYLRGELSGSFSVLHGIASNTVYLPAKGSDYISRWTGWDEFTCQTVIKYGGLDYFPTGDIGAWKNDSVLGALARLILGGTCLVIHSTGMRKQLQFTALANMLVTISIAVRAVASAIRSTFIFSTAKRIIIRTLMAHKNSREPAYSPISRLPLYQSLAGLH